jgi:hypothetical protein
VGFPKDTAIEQEKPVAFLHAVTKVGVDSPDTAWDSRTEVRASILVGQDLPRLGFEDRPDRTERHSVRPVLSKGRAPFRQFEDTGPSG